jgi:hypothetical protein
MGDGTEAAVARAMISQNQEGSGTARKALPQVGTMGLLTNGMELIFFQDTANLLVCGSRGEPSFQPWGLAFLNPLNLINGHFTSLPISG